MDAHDLIGKQVTITGVDLYAKSSRDVAHIAMRVDGATLVFEAYLDPARAKAALTLLDEATWLRRATTQM